MCYKSCKKRSDWAVAQQRMRLCIDHKSLPHLSQVIKVVLVSDPLVVGLHTVWPVGNVSYVFSLTNKELSLEELMRKKKNRNAFQLQRTHNRVTEPHYAICGKFGFGEWEGRGGLDLALTSAYIILLKELKTNILEIRNAVKLIKVILEDLKTILIYLHIMYAKSVQNYSFTLPHTTTPP